MATSSIIIPTYNRPEEIRACIRSVLKQTVKPQEIILVDDGNLGGFPLRDQCKQEGIACIYHRKTVRGLTRSRNIGIGLASSDILFFLDDDVVLFTDYIDEILQTYALRSFGRIMGVGGSIVNEKPLSKAERLRHLLDRVFVVSGSQEGRVLPSGFSTDFGTTGRELKEVTAVDFLPGGVSSYRKEVFDLFSFSEKYSGYGMGEDKDFSYRVSRQYRLVVNPRARLYHHESPKMRYDKTRETREIVMGRYNLFRDHLQTTPWSWFRFSYALFGYLVVRSLIFCLSPKKGNRQRVQGILMAIMDMARNRISIGY